MNLRDAELDIATHLNGAGLGVSMTDAPPTLYAGPFPASAPDKMLSVRNAGGQSEEYLGTAQAVVSPELQVTVRGNRERYEETATWAREVWAALHFPEVAGYVYVRAEGSGPIWMGTDEDGRPTWLVNVTAQYVAER